MSTATLQRPPILTPVGFVPLGDGTFRAVARKPVDPASVNQAAKMNGAKRDVIYSGFLDTIKNAFHR